MNRTLVIGNYAVLAIYSLSLSAMAQSGMQTQSDGSENVVGYDQVREIIRKRCVACHNPDEMRGDLNLAGFDVVLAGASSGPIVVAGKPNQSLLYKSAAHLDDPVMPPNSPRIPGRELDLIRRWIEDGLAEKTGPRGAMELASPKQPAVEPKSVEAVRRLQSARSTTGLKSVRPVLRASAIVDLAAHPSKSIVALSGNQQAVLLDIATGEWLGAFDFPGDVTALRFSRDGRLLVVGGGVAGLSGRVIAFDLVSGEQVFELADENDTILSLDLSPDGSSLAVGGPAKVVRVFDVSSGKVLHTLRKHTDWVLAVRFSPDGLLLASGDRFGGLFVWDPQSGQEFHTLRAHVGAIHALTWDGGETLISGGEDGNIRTWNMHHGARTGEWKAGVGAILSLDSGGPLVACGGRDKKLNLWRGPEEFIASKEGTDQFQRVVFTADHKYAVSDDSVGCIRTLEVDTLKVRSEVTLPVDAAERQAVSDRLSKAQQLYVEKSKLAEPLDFAPQAVEATTNDQPDARIALAAHIKESQVQVRAIRQNALALNKAADAAAQAIAAASTAIQQLQQTHVELRSQIESQEAELASAEKHRLELERIYQLLSNSVELTSTDSAALRKQILSRLQRQQELLDSANNLREQVAADAQLQVAQQLVDQLAQELRQRVEHTVSQLEEFEVQTHKTVLGSQP